MSALLPGTLSADMHAKGTWNSVKACYLTQKQHVFQNRCPEDAPQEPWRLMMRESSVALQHSSRFPRVARFGTS